MKYIVYKTTNIVNNKIYIGVHKTQNPNKFDRYIGNGVIISKNNSEFKVSNADTPFRKALNKYGVQNFIRETISCFDTEDEAYKLEEELVDEEFISRNDTYNLKLGGLHANNIGIKKVNQYDMEGNFLKTWDSIAQAADFYNIQNTHIISSCKDRAISANGYVWRYFNENTSSIIVRKKKITSTLGRKYGKRTTIVEIELTTACIVQKQ